MSEIKCAVITISDKGSTGDRIDTSGPAICEMLSFCGWETVYTSIIPDDPDKIEAELIHCCDDLKTALVLTTGGTGFSPRDNTPEATRKVIEKDAYGIPLLMMTKSLEITDRACLSRSVCGIRGRSLILNLPGSEKAVRENLSFVLKPLEHGLMMLLGEGSADCGSTCGRVKAVCISEVRGVRKKVVDVIHLIPGYGIENDAHAGTKNRNISLLADESVDTLRGKLTSELRAGDFAENILTSGIKLHTLPIGTKLRIGECECEITQIGKECHSDCEIRRLTGDCVMPREGIFVKALNEGRVKAGDMISIL